jgi:N-acetyltransferase
MHFNIQPTLDNETVYIRPLNVEDFENLYAVASDPLIWKQHPNKNRFKRDVFEIFFKGAVESGGALIVIDNKTQHIAGCTRFYDYDPDKKSILIGYTFYAVKYWGTSMNPLVKKLMLDYIFQFVETVQLHVGAENKRSQIAVSRLGAIKTGEKSVAYYGEPEIINFVYEISKENWQH